MESPSDKVCSFEGWCFKNHEGFEHFRGFFVLQGCHLRVTWMFALSALIDRFAIAGQKKFQK